MESTPQMEQIAKGIRGLTIAIWSLVAVSLFQVAAWMVPMLAPNFYMRYIAPSTPDAPRESFENWQGLSFEDKVKRSSIVLITEYKSEGGKLRAIIKEELKRQPGTTYHYAVGDEYLPLSIVPRENTTYGEGSLVLLQGSPAVNRESYSIFNGSVSSLGEMPLSKVRKIVAQSQ
jgi:hypothetical protein